MNPVRISRWSLRRKLIVACVLVQLGAMVLVLFAGTRLMQRMLEEQAAVQAVLQGAVDGREGLSTGPLRLVRDVFGTTGLLVAAAALAMSVALQAVIAHALTRNLRVGVNQHAEPMQERRRQPQLHPDMAPDRQTQQQRVRLALVDPLTDLLNRRGLFEALHEAIGRSERTGAGVSLLFIDLDDFKHANDVAGHRAGDQILVMVARALQGLLQPDQQVARMGSDEFAVIAPGNDAQQVADLAGRLVQTVSALRFAFDGNRIRIGCSIGVAMVPLDATAADQLVACADRAMHQAKLGGKNGYCLYQHDSAHARAERERVSWNGRIFGALRDHRLQLHFQPVHRVSDLGIVYYEALVRMVDEDDASQLIGPTAFVPHAERSGKIRQIDRWVFQACIDKLVQSPPSVCIAANLSARSLDDPGFADFLRAALRRSDVDPRRLHIELTETAAMGDMIAARPMIAALRAVGCAVHLDDFGSGFSSFEHLKLLEVDGIKIDGSFIRDLTSDPSNQLVVASLIHIARRLNKTTVAECVEDAATLDALRELGVDHVQGFHLGRPARKLAERGARDPRSAVTSQRRSVGVAGA